MTYTQEDYNRANQSINDYHSEQSAIRLNGKKITNPIPYSTYEKAKSLVDTYLKQKNAKSSVQNKMKL